MINFNYRLYNDWWLPLKNIDFEHDVDRIHFNTCDDLLFFYKCLFLDIVLTIIYILLGIIGLISIPILILLNIFTLGAPLYIWFVLRTSLIKKYDNRLYNYVSDDILED